MAAYTDEDLETLLAMTEKDRLMLSAQLLQSINIPASVGLENITNTPTLCFTELKYGDLDFPLLGVRYRGNGYTHNIVPIGGKEWLDVFSSFESETWGDGSVLIVGANHAALYGCMEDFRNNVSPLLQINGPSLSCNKYKGCSDGLAICSNCACDIQRELPSFFEGMRGFESIGNDTNVADINTKENLEGVFSVTNRRGLVISVQC